MKVTTRFISILAESVFILLILSSCAYVFYSVPGAAGLFTNADMVLFPTLFADLSENPTNLWGWSLAEAPFYFPDILIFFIINFLVKKPILSIQIYGLIQFLLLFLATRWLFHELGGKQGWVHTLIFSGGALLVTAFFALLMRNSSLQGVGYSFLLSNIHFGTYVVSIACLASGLRSLRTGKIAFLILSSVVVFLTTLSDLLFLLYFVIPFLATSIIFIYLKTFTRSQVKTLGLAIIFASGSAYFLNRNKHINVISHINKNLNRLSLGHAFKGIYQFFSDVFSASPEAYCFIFIFVIFPFVYILWDTIRLFRVWVRRRLPQEAVIDIPLSEVDFNRNDRNPTPEMLRGFTKVFVLVSVFATMAAVFAFGRYADAGTLRYFFPLTYSAVLALLLLELEFEQAITRHSKVVKLGTAGVTGAILVLLVPFLGNKPLAELFPAPNYASCLRNSGNIAGLAEYWQSQPLILFSNRQVQIAAVTQEGNPYYWNNNRYWYIDNWANPEQYPDFKFIFMQKLDAQAIKQKYGQPDRIVPCDGSEIWFYNQPGFLYSRLMEGNFEPFQRAMIWRGQTTIPAALLSGNTGMTNGLERIAQENRDPKGFLTAGSVLELPEGRYLAQIEYLSNNASFSSANAKVSLVASSLEEKDLTSQSLPITNSKIRTVALEFFVAQSSPIEVKVFYEGKGDLVVRNITLKRINI